MSLCAKHFFVRAGALRQIEAVLAPPSSLDDFIKYHESGDIGATWAFACRYRLESVLKQVECKIQACPLTAMHCLEHNALNLPASSADSVASSLARMLVNIGNSWAKMTDALRAHDTRYTEEYLSCPSNRHKYVVISAVRSVLGSFKKVADDMGPK